MNVNKIPIPILGLRRAIPYNSNSEPILSVWRILQPNLSEILIPLTLNINKRTYQNPPPPHPSEMKSNLALPKKKLNLVGINKQ